MLYIFRCQVHARALDTLMYWSYATMLNEMSAPEDAVSIIWTSRLSSGCL